VRKNGQQHLNIFQLVQVDVDQFFGIEIEKFPTQIAQVALWLTDHQMNMQVSEEFGQYFRRLPLIHSARIVCGNALRMDWNDVVSAEQVDFILGNPPFVGKKEQSASQKADMSLIFSKVNSAEVLDYVTAWYLKAVQYLRGNDKAAGLLDGLFGKTEGPGDRVKIAFVSTNSITQGEQVGVLWSELLRLGVKIHFAHRTFSWSNEARGNAAVHCVIIGFGLHDTTRKTIFEYESPNGEPHAIAAANINPYLVNAADILVGKRNKPICDVPEMGYGSKPADGGNLILTEDEKTELLTADPDAAIYLRAYVGAAVLDARAAHPESSLADLYDPIAMPPDLRRAHQALDRAVDAAYGKKTFTSDAGRVAFLFDLYHRYTSLLPASETKKKGRRKQ
jgi:hypothetical protein